MWHCTRTFYKSVSLITVIYFSQCLFDWQLDIYPKNQLKSVNFFMLQRWTGSSVDSILLSFSWVSCSWRTITLSSLEIVQKTVFKMSRSLARWTKTEPTIMVFKKCLVFQLIIQDFFFKTVFQNFQFFFSFFHFFQNVEKPFWKKKSYMISWKTKYFLLLRFFLNLNFWNNDYLILPTFWP